MHTKCKNEANYAEWLVSNQKKPLEKGKHIAFRQGRVLNVGIGYPASVVRRSLALLYTVVVSGALAS